MMLKVIDFGLVNAVKTFGNKLRHNYNFIHYGSESWASLKKYIQKYSNATKDRREIHVG